MTYDPNPQQQEVKNHGHQKHQLSSAARTQIMDTKSISNPQSKKSQIMSNPQQQELKSRTQKASATHKAKTRETSRELRKVILHLKLGRLQNPTRDD